MKTAITIFIFLVFNTLLFSQSFNNDFEDETLQGWTNNDESTTLLTVEGNSTNHYLQKECDGTNSAIGEMTIINRDENYWAGNYFYGIPGFEYMVNIDEIYMKNDNDFDIYLRYGFTGANGYKVITTNPIIIPANSDWDIYDQYFYLNFPTIGNLTILNDTTGLTIFEIFDNINEMFEEVIEFKIFHNEEISFEGQIVSGTLQIDNIFTYLLLSNEDQEETITLLYPNPVKGIMSIKLPNTDYSEVKIYNLLGEEIRSYSFSERTNNINLSELNSGVYMAKIKTGNKTVTKKIIKL